MDASLPAFYQRLAEVSFLVLGFWLATLQLRGGATADPERRRVAHAVAVQLALPAAASLLVLADDGGGRVWRAVFAVAAVYGAGAAVRFRARRAAGLPRALTLSWVLVVLLCAGIGLVALLPASALPLHPLRMEALLFGTLVFVSVNQAFALVLSD